MIVDLRLGRRSPTALDGALARARAQELTYAHVGSTLSAAPDEGEARSRHREVTGVDGFDAAVTALRSWGMLRNISASVHPADAAVRVGETILVVLRIGPFEVVVPNRVVAVIDEPGRFGFAYGTLPGHPEEGEEAFLVERTAGDTVRITVRVHSRPSSRFVRTVAPAAREVQNFVIRRYLGAIADVVALHSNEPAA